MIDIQKPKVEEYFGETFLYVGEGKIDRGSGKSGHIQLLCGLHDDSYKKEITFDITDSSLEENGDFSDINMSKEELRIFIDFLEKRYQEMESTDEIQERKDAEVLVSELGISQSSAKFIMSVFPLSYLSNLDDKNNSEFGHLNMSKIQFDKLVEITSRWYNERKT